MVLSMQSAMRQRQGIRCTPANHHHKPERKGIPSTSSDGGCHSQHTPRALGRQTWHRLQEHHGAATKQLPARQRTEPHQTNVHRQHANRPCKHHDPAAAQERMQQVTALQRSSTEGRPQQGAARQAVRQPVNQCLEAGLQLLSTCPGGCRT
jgi:hypothetical protein